MTDPLAFALAVLVLLATPGPTNTLMATAGATRPGPPWLLLLAELCGYLAIIWLARLILLPLIEAQLLVGTVIKIAVALYLVFAAIRLWRQPLTIAAGGAPVGPPLVALTTFLNPKGLIFALSIFPREHPALAGYFALFAVLVLGCGFAWFAGGRALAAVAGRRASLLPRVGAVALLVFAVLVARSATG